MVQPARLQNENAEHARRRLRRRERMRALALVGGLLVVLALGLLVVLSVGRANRLERRLNALQRQTREARGSGAAAPAEPGAVASSAPSAPPAEPASAQAAAPEPAEPPDASPAPMDETELAARLTGLLERDALGAFHVTDPAAAAVLLSEVALQRGPVSWTARSWELLALLAWKIGRSTDAERFAQAARADGATPALFYRTAADDALRRDLLGEAARWIRELTRSPQEVGAARLRAAELALRKDEYAAAEQFTQAVQSSADLGPSDRLRLGRVMVRLEAWPALRGLLDDLDDVPAAGGAARAALLAIAALQSGPDEAAVERLVQLAEADPRDPMLALWCGIGQMRLGRAGAARAALERAATLDAGPAPTYWTGILALRAGDSAAARSAFERAIRRTPQFAPPYEALAVQALNQDDLEAARAQLAAALARSPSRASSRFLLALCEAKAGDLSAAARELEAAVGLDPAYLKIARQAEALALVLPMLSQGPRAPPTQPASAPTSAP